MSDLMWINRRDSRSFPLVLLGTVVTLLVCFGPVGSGQDTKATRSVAKSPGPTRTLLTPDACAQCHGATSPRPTSRFGPKDAPGLVRLDEFTTWNERDKHRRAYDALQGERGREIGRRMGLTDVTRDRACLTCHSTGFLPEDPPAEASGALEARSQGVGCTACHGPYLEWVQNHGLAGEPIRRWRRLSPAEKTRDHGMTNLRDPATRAKVCLSCHLGDANEAKVVSHAMYAAGHPPLPGIEVVSFARAMPTHWWEPDEVPLFREDPSMMASYRVDRSDSAVSKAVLIGGVVAFRESMRLLAAQTDGNNIEGKRSPRWPEYASFECYSCHHDLMSPGYRGWRQVRGFGLEFDGLVMKGKAGKPRLRPWTLTLVGPALSQVEASADALIVRQSIREGVKALNVALDERLFGEPEAIALAAKHLDAASDQLLKELEGQRFDRSMLPRLIATLTSLSAKSFPDYDSARQLAWALGSIHRDWRPQPSPGDRTVEAIGELDRLLKLDPHASREPRTKLVADQGLMGDRLGEELLRLSEDEYRSSLTRAADYDPVQFKKILARLSDLMSQTALQPLPR